MAATPILGLVATPAVAGPATCDRAGIADLVSSTLSVRAWLDAIDADIACRAAALAAAVASNHRSTA